MLKLDPVPKAVTFDCYGTLVQWHRAVREAARTIFSARIGSDGAEEQATSLADRLRTVAATQQAQPPFRDYKAVLRSSLDQVLAEAVWTGWRQSQLGFTTALIGDS